MGMTMSGKERTHTGEEDDYEESCSCGKSFFLLLTIIWDGSNNEQKNL